ncbi:unnamed protein product [Ambrosiozyma monospora]|uniref:Unnamed protein product n=1 Tax=Ambrosiozyma monospora TaxID=43982 RepID=A0ACB5T1I4_AMBMO|nr:unnamed protein product [Ambrosiozyma monospora]
MSDNTTYKVQLENVSSSPELNNGWLFYICKDLPPELKELILAYAVVYVSQERKWRLGDTLKRTVPQEFELFIWTLHLFRQRPVLKVESFYRYYSRNPGRGLPDVKSYFELIPQVILQMDMTTNSAQKRIFQTCDFTMLSFTFSLSKVYQKFLKSLIQLGPKQITAKLWYSDPSWKLDDLMSPMLTSITYLSHQFVNRLQLR